MTSLLLTVSDDEVPGVVEVEVAKEGEPLPIIVVDETEGGAGPVGELVPVLEADGVAKSVCDVEEVSVPPDDSPDVMGFVGEVDGDSCDVELCNGIVVTVAGAVAVVGGGSIAEAVALEEMVVGEKVAVAMGNDVFVKEGVEVLLKGVELIGDGAGVPVELMDRVLVAERVKLELEEAVELLVLETLGLRLGVSVGDGERRLATLRLRMVALATPASLASQEYTERSAPAGVTAAGDKGGNVDVEEAGRGIQVRSEQACRGERVGVAHGRVAAGLAAAVFVSSQEVGARVKRRTDERADEVHAG